jgi:calcium-translocating P-type ATPase
MEGPTLNGRSVHRHSVEDAFRALRSAPAGLAPEEAARRVALFGRNDVERLARPSPLVVFARQLGHFLAVVLWVAAALCFAAELANPGAGMATLGFAIVGVVLVNGVFSFAQEHRAERALAALEDLLPTRVNVMRGAVLIEIDAGDLVPGDVVLLEEGDRVPADCRVTETFGIRVNNATLTGESAAVALSTEPSVEASPVRAGNLALAGTSVASGRAQALVYATGAATQFSQIARLTQQQRPALSPLQKELTGVTRVLAAVAVALGAVFFAVGEMLGVPLWGNVLFAIGIVVAMVPEGLLPTVTLALAMSAQRMARRNAIVRHLPSVEALGAATVILSDKTGTITENRMAARRLFLGAEFESVDPSRPAPPLDAQRRAFFEACLLCENIRERGGPARHEWLGDPMEVALVELARRVLPDLLAAERVAEVPFDTRRRRLSTVHRVRGALVLHTKGALESLLPLCERVASGAAVLPLDAARRERFVAAESELGEQGLRVLAVATRPVSPGEPSEALERGLTLLGLVAIEDPPRRDVADAIRRCREAGIRALMVTGDHPRTAVAIAQQVGLVGSTQPLVATGAELARMSDAELQLLLDAPEIVFARLEPYQKTRLVALLQRKGEVVAVTGDGVNDAPALRLADIGVAMGRSGTDVARAASDLVLADDHFASIVAAIEEGRGVYANIRKFLTYILTSNVPELVPYLVFVLARVPLPLTIIQILAVDLGTDILPALALGAERAEPGVLRRPPRRRSERLLDGALLARAYLFLGVLEAAASLAVYAFVLLRGGWRFGEPLAWNDPLYRQATTACLVTIVVMQVANAFLCRSERDSLFPRGLRGSRLLLAAVAAESILIALATYTPAGNRVFGTLPVGAEVWLAAMPCALAMVACEEGRKAIARRRAA